MNTIPTSEQTHLLESLGEQQNTDVVALSNQNRKMALGVSTWGSCTWWHPFLICKQMNVA